MNLYIYSDESGVFDKVHNDYFVFGGLVLFSKEHKENSERKYRTAENTVRAIENMSIQTEVKASAVSNSSKGKLMRSLNSLEKFGIVIDQQRLRDEIFCNGKIKQRYLDWAYKYAVRRKFEQLISDGLLSADDVQSLYFFIDEHHTATDGVYELKESIEQEMKYGIFDFYNNNYIPPLFPNLSHVHLEFRDSKTVTLIRAADITANRLYHAALSGDYSGIDNKKFFLSYHP